MQIKLSLNDTEKNILNITKNTELNLDQIYHLGLYFKLLNKRPSNKIISNQGGIIHSHQYDMNEKGVYWLILTKKFKMMDVCIPPSSDNLNKVLFDNFSEMEIEIVNIIRNKL